MFCFWRGAIRRQHTSHGSILAEVWWRTCCQHTSREERQGLVLDISSFLFRFVAPLGWPWADPKISKPQIPHQRSITTDPKPQINNSLAPFRLSLSLLFYLSLSLSLSLSNQRSITKDPKPKIHKQRSQTKDHEPKINNQRPQIKDPSPKIPNQRSQTKDPKPQIPKGKSANQCDRNILFRVTLG